MIQTLRHWFIPHHSNNFRARLLHLDVFAMYVVVFFLLSVSMRVVHKIDPTILGFATDIRVDQLLSLTNQKRIESNIEPLKLNALLSQAAAAKAADMFTNGYWSHTSPSGTTPWDFINSSGYVYSVAGENLAKNFSDSTGVVEAWMNSPSHRENILRGQYQDIGFAVVNGTLNGEETTLVVQMFGSRSGESLTQNVTQPTVATVVASPSPIALSTPLPIAQALIIDTSPTPEPQLIAPLQQVDNKVELLPLAQSVIKKPVVDMGVLLKQLTLGLSVLLMVVLVVDGIYVWHHKIPRLTGRNLAHIVFIGIIDGYIMFMSFGSII